jgi:hypothetical protein
MRRILSIAGILAVLLGLLTSTASASSSASGLPARSVPAHAVTGARDAGTTAVRRAAVCLHTGDFYGRKKSYLCGTSYKRYPNAGGAERGFLIGSDHHVWNIYRDRRTGAISGWRSLGGYAKRGVWDHWAIRADVGIRVIGADDRSWCKVLSSGRWTEWHRC